jgi:hypothetical protein
MRNEIRNVFKRSISSLVFVFRKIQLPTGVMSNVNCFLRIVAQSSLVLVASVQISCAQVTPKVSVADKPVYGPLKGVGTEKKWPFHNDQKLIRSVEDPKLRKYLEDVKWLYENIGRVTVKEIETRFGLYVVGWRPRPGKLAFESENLENRGKPEYLGFDISATCELKVDTCKPAVVSFDTNDRDFSKWMELAAFQAILGMHDEELQSPGHNPTSTLLRYYSKVKEGQTASVGIVAMYVTPQTRALGLVVPAVGQFGIYIKEKLNNN